VSYHFYITPAEYETAEQNGINARLLTKRIRDCAWGIEKAITTPPRQKGKWDAWLTLAAKNGISVDAFRTRIHRGMEPSMAATAPILSRSEIIEQRVRIHPKCYADLAEQNGIKARTYESRVYRGWEPEKAATTPTMTSREVGLRAKEHRKKWDKLRPQKFYPMGKSSFMGT